MEKKQTKGRKTPAMLKELRNKIKQLYYVRRISMQEVADSLNICLKTVQRHCKEIDKEMEGAIQERSLKSIVKRRILDHDKVIEKLWRIYDKEPVYTEKARTLSRIDRSNERFIDSMIKLGVVPKVVEKHELSLIGKIIKTRYKNEGKRTRVRNRTKVRATRKAKAVS